MSDKVLIRKDKKTKNEDAEISPESSAEIILCLETGWYVSPLKAIPRAPPRYGQFKIMKFAAAVKMKE